MVVHDDKALYKYQIYFTFYFTSQLKKLRDVTEAHAILNIIYNLLPTKKTKKLPNCHFTNAHTAFINFIFK